MKKNDSKINKFIPVNTPLLNSKAKKYLSECIDTGWISSEGPFVTEFEEKIAGKVKRKYGIAVANGTAALQLAVEALGLKQNDEVIMPAFTIISCAQAVVKVGAKPVLVDSDPLTWNMDVSEVEKRITKKTRAIMTVHIYGLPVDMDPLLKLADKYGLKIIEDAAEAHGLNYKGSPCGSFGDVSVFSFYPNKLITTGEGGMLMTDDAKIAQKARSLRNLCFLPERRFVHEELGYNFRMTNIQAALGLAQLERWNEFINKKRSIGKKYSEKLKTVESIQLPLAKTAYARNIYWVYGVVLKDRVPFNAQKAMKLLASKNIGTRPFFFPMHKQPVFVKMGLFKNEKYPVAEMLAERGFYLPSGLALTDSEIGIVALSLKQIFK